MLSNSIYDGNLLSLSTRNGDLEIGISSGGGLRKIIVGGLERLRVSDFKEGNIINAAYVFSGKDDSCSEERMGALLKYVYDIDDAGLKNNESLRFLTGKIEEIKRGMLLVLEIEPSCGGYVVAVDKSISLV